MKRATSSLRRRHKGEEGIVLLMVILLILMFSGLGLLAMRHLQGELRSSGAYFDSTQAAAAAESAVMMTATDMRRNWRYPNAAAACLNYYSRFQQAMEADRFDHIKTGFSDVFNTEDNCNHMGTVPLAVLNGTAPIALTGGPLDHGYANVPELFQDAPELAPPPPGFSSDDEARTYAWYYFTVTSRAEYGYGPSLSTTGADTDADTEPDTEAAVDNVVRGNAVVRAHMKIGPVDAIGSN